MKKLIAILLAALMLFSMTACGSAPAETTESTELVELTTAQGDAQLILDDFAKKMSAEWTALELAEALAAADYLPFEGTAAAVEPGWLMGFSAEEITGFEEGAMFAPMIGTIPFIGYVFTLEEGADVESFMQTLLDHADPRWNICTEAEEVLVAAVDHTVIFLMTPLSFDGE